MRCTRFAESRPGKVFYFNLVIDASSGSEFCCHFVPRRSSRAYNDSPPFLGSFNYGLRAGLLIYINAPHYRLFMRGNFSCADMGLYRTYIEIFPDTA